jgi:hypothetical protein
MTAKECASCEYSSRYLGDPGAEHMCWRVGTNPAPGDDDITVEEARMAGMPCGPAGAFFETNGRLKEIDLAWAELDSSD